MRSVVLLVCFLHLSSPVIHNYKAFYTATTGIDSVPEFRALGMVDDVIIATYSSWTKRAEPGTDWMRNSEGPEYWKRQTDIMTGTEQSFASNIKVAMERFNQTRGVHTWMSMYGCQWDDETGAVDAFDNWGYDGEDFVTLDLKNMRYIATTPESLITKYKWDNDQGWLASNKQYLTQECTDWLKKYVQYGRSTLERKVAPKVNLLQKDSEVVCHSTGFYPDGIMITWKRDGEEIQEDVKVGETLPNEDGTFQKRAVLTVSPEQRKKGQYTCEVDHKSGPTIVKTLIVEDGGNSLGIIIGCVVAAVIVIGVIAAIVVMMKKKDYKKAEQSDSDSDASSPTRA